MTFKHRWAEGQFDRLPVLAADLIRRKVDVIAAVSGDVSIRAVMIANSAIPVVFITGSDPVESGLVPSFARPGGNITGFSMISNDLMSKRFELLSELVPQIRVISLLVNPNYHGATEGTIPLVQRAASAKGMQLHIARRAKRTISKPPLPHSSNRRSMHSSWAPTRSLQADASRSWHWRRVTPFQRSMSGKNLQRREALLVMEPASPLFTARLGSMLERFSRIVIPWGDVSTAY